ncbi:metallophosphoesterase [Mucilaginibacter myungsuensis]|uniref:Metallophosphoesterase n=1 Tax=Mucilaginibacter myungsuensis TaxID=649104 RepID=A0A929PYW4_9SPHI|nr:metallophosphoesterase [Mucilaginibacter myungsuensis]MBE9663875.1 metallophosphoesterase [Mucilaginibacter myungsuensis]MDN3598409.1 metallophosphoesterase [Mucilaginibacter myungsuensis]
MHSLFIQLLVGAVLLLIDAYLFHGLKAAFVKRKFVHSKLFPIIYWTFSIGIQVALLCCIYVKLGVGIRAMFMVLYFITQTSKLCFLPFLVIDDIRRLIIRARTKKEPQPVVETTTSEPAKPLEQTPISRSSFLMQAGIMATAVPIVGMGAGLMNKLGCFDYRIKRVNLYLPNLPKKFDGLRLGQISDIHTGSLRRKDRVRIRGGVEMLQREKADLIFFTGDLVNDVATDVKHVYDIFQDIKAPLGVFSILGNHDYGDYSQLTGEPRRKNREDMKTIHKNYGWDLMLNENRRLKVDGEEIGILGMENWGMLSRFPKYGNMEQTVKNTDDLPVKLLLSHDPSHWRAEVVAKYPQIDMVFAGHTHGMQFGVRTDDFQWSPVEYLYSEWAGLYREKQQQIYVNVGYGYVGFPGRVGILPEITIFTLRSGEDPALKA